MYLNTKSCCFFCLKATEEKYDDLETNKGNVSLFKLQNLCRFLQINLNVAAFSQSCIEGTGNLNVSLCSSCVNTTGQFTRLFLELDRVQMEMSYWIGLLHKEMVKASQTPELVQEYSKRMTSDLEALSKLVFVDKLRKEVSMKCEAMSKVDRLLQIRINRIEKLPENYRITAKSKPEVEDDRVDIVFCPIPEDEPIRIKLEADYGDGLYTASSPDLDESFHPLASSPSPPASQVPRSPSPPPSPPVISSRQGGSHKPILKDVHYRITETNRFECLSCNKTFDSMMGARFHIRTVHFGKRYKCPKCKDQFTLNFSLKKHMKSCTGVKKKRTAPTPSGFILGKHVTRNEATGEFTCSSCNKSFAKLKSAREHYAYMHLNFKKGFKCDWCELFVNTKEHFKTCKVKNEVDIKSHKSLQLNTKLTQKEVLKLPFVCQLCRKGFQTKWKLASHHSNAHQRRKYECDLCEKKFKQVHHLGEHKDSVHLRKKFFCRFCNKMYRSRSKFGVHEKSCKKRKVKTESSDVKETIWVN